ncbi:MAG TPA: phosphotransferase [Micromonosporaceae bacterium]|nr:phosphotransferase [Micromonosporaceae bacterium]
MTRPVYIKHYADPARAIAAGAHLSWLRQLCSGVRLPHLHRGTAPHLVLEHLDGRLVQPADLEHVAAVLGRLHGTAHARELHAAHLDRDYTSSTGLTLRRFPTGREHVLTDADTGLTDLPAALYKDCNLRNVVITADGPALVDFDDLTLAPFGYDLAKLVVSTAMTHGRLPDDQIGAALHAYNVAVDSTGAGAAECTWRQLAQYSEIHHRLTARYVGRNGYQHPWPAVSPWPRPSAETRPR